MDKNNLVERYIPKLYKDINGFTINSNDKVHELQKSRDTIFTTYGEILQPSVSSLINEIDITRDDVIYDLGSGIGKVCAQLFLQTNAKKIVGIEIVETRHNVANRTKNKLSSKFPSKFRNQRLEFLNMDINDTDMSEATLIYMCSTCYSEALLNGIVDKIDKLPNVRAIISLKQLPRAPTKLPIISEVKIPCSWSPGTTAQIYKAN